ncbi:MAG: alanine racemase [Elusimicrobium sp.]|jgi:alanine racemase|nr:alanine racemase [Elusimicrobium sp.]
MGKILRPTWAEIDLAAMENNLRFFHAAVGPDTKVLFVLKANAYGHGAAPLAKFAEEKHLCEMLGTASVEEGILLRAAGVKLPVLVLGSIYPFEAFEDAAKNNLSVTIASLSAAKAVRALADKLGQTVRCHVKQDTGMGRIGTRRDGVIKILSELSLSKNILIEGLYTHLSCPDTDCDFTDGQLGFFEDAALEAKARKFDIKMLHSCATLGTLFAPRGRYDMVRVGIGAYGALRGVKELKPVLSFKTKIVFIKDIKKCFSISYNRSFTAEADMKVATLPVGYGDGYLRALSNKGKVLINGKFCKVLGNVTMDMMMVDVTAAPEAKVGDEVVLIGRQGNSEISACDAADWAGTISYEILTLITARVPRVYI